LDHGPWLKDVLVFLAAAGLVVPLFHRARIGAVLGCLQLGGRLLEALGVSDEAVLRRLDELREHELARLVAAREQVS
jgi:Kef-type K+ transport system membrane component KefB